MIRVLQVVGNMDYGGVETLLMELFRHIDRAAVQFDFLVHDNQKGLYDDEIYDLGGQIYRIPSIGKSSYRRHTRALRQQFSSQPHLQVVHSHINQMNGIILRQAKLAGVPIRVSHAHIDGGREALLRTALRNYSRFLIRHSATHGFACSQAASEFVHRGSVRDHTRVLNNAIDLVKFHPDETHRRRMRLELGLNGAFVLGHVGRFYDQKNHAHLVDVFDQVHAMDQEARLLLVGVGVLRAQIEDEIQARGLEHAVRFLGSRSDVADLMNAMDVFVFPSKYEGLGIVAIEAQAMGLPVLASDAVPRETDVTELITYLPLGQTAPWVDSVMSLKAHTTQMHTRLGCGDAVAKAGYDIRRVAIELQQFYVDTLRDLEARQGLR